MSWLDKLEKAPDDPILGITLAFNSDPNKDKINLGVGAYRDDKGNPYILPVIHKATEILKNTLGEKHNKEYLPIEGLAQFRELTAKVLFGEDCKQLKEKKISIAQSLSGTGALRLAAEFIKHNGDNKEIWVSNPTWGNHHNIFKDSSLTVKEYRYYDDKTRGLDFKAFMEDLDKATQGATIVFHACAHNPTGVDPTFEQWKEIASLVQRKKLFVLFDIAYQGYASGDLDNDAKALRYFVSLEMPMIVCQSYAKNFGLYGERIGSISLVCSSQNAAECALSRLKLIIRTNYSNPPKHGAYLVATVLSDENLYKEWIGELKKMSGRILELRKKLYDLLTNVYKTPGDWSHIVKQIGMFTYTGLNPNQVNELKEKFHIYLHSSGRISMAGLNTGNIEVFAKAVHQVVSNPSNL